MVCRLACSGRSWGFVTVRCLLCFVACSVLFFVCWVMTCGRTCVFLVWSLVGRISKREECDRLIRIIKSRVIDSHMIGDTENKSLSELPSGIIDNDSNMPEFCSAAVTEAKKWSEKKKSGSNSKSTLDLGSYILNTTMLSDVSKNSFFSFIQFTEGETGSLVDVAKSYMQTRPPWASPSTSYIGYSSPSPTRTQLFKEETPYSLGCSSASKVIILFSLFPYFSCTLILHLFVGVSGVIRVMGVSDLAVIFCFSVLPAVKGLHLTLIAILDSGLHNQNCTTSKEVDGTGDSFVANGFPSSGLGSQNSSSMCIEGISQEIKASSKLVVASKTVIANKTNGTSEKHKGKKLGKYNQRGPKTRKG
ncbi:hypothetical protein Ddye_023348 [Dipteronia dyeriana]|uniref:Uncharacterized protein n=1 Tax=Dipteronia dyeriana TaxID=168575 RepID=A0AAD9TSR0_9ROSI|nr:hypothetical protein Ddye_023348 [Dipteronia dyeriana]